MITKINRQACLKQFPAFPISNYDPVKDDVEYFYPDSFANYVLTLDEKSEKENRISLGIEMKNLTLYSGFGDFIFLGDNKNYWLTTLSLRRNDYKPLKDAVKYLLDKKVGKRFNGALAVDSAELPEFIKHLSCLITCDASLPYIYFMDKGQNLLGSICQYGNIHLDTLNKQADKVFKKALKKTKLIVVKDKKCYPKFSKTSAIKKRRLDV